MPNDYDLNKPRTLRCTGPEMDYLKKVLAEYRADNVLDAGTGICIKAPGVQGPICRTGVSIADFLKNHGLPVPDSFVSDEQPNESDAPESSEEPDYTEWQSDPVMIEIDRGCCYEIDSMGYPEEAERFARRYPEIWKKLYVAKQNKKTDTYNEIMYNEVWGRVKDGRF